MFWGYFNSRGTGQLIAIVMMKSENYHKILEENLQLSVQNLNLGRQFTFLQDNNSKHV